MAAFLAVQNMRKEREYRSHRNALDLGEKEFRRLFRLGKESFAYLCAYVRGDLERECLEKKTVMTVEQQVLTALRFYATGGDQISVSTNEYIASSQGQVSQCIKRVSEAIIKNLGQLITLPNDEEKKANKNAFYHYRNNNFPGIVGVIDGTEVKIIAPDAKKYNQGAFFCHKNFFAMNAMIVCDADLKILNIDAKFPGAAHDSYVWKQSNLRRACEYEGYLGNREWLIGDSGYGLEPWLLTPIANPKTRAEEEYNRAFKSTRCIVERCIGVLKMRFRCLTGLQGALRYSPERCHNIIVACAILHNLCILFREPKDLPNPFNPDEIDDNLLAQFDLQMMQEQSTNAAPVPHIALTTHQKGRRNQQLCVNSFR